MIDQAKAVADTTRKSHAALVLRLVGLSDLVVGIGLIFMGPMLVAGIDEIWWIVGALIAVTGVVMAIVGQRIDPSNRVR